MKAIQDTKINPADKTKPRNSIFVWLDILGYSAAVEDEKKYGELAQLLKKFQELFNESDRYNSTIISDGIILEIFDTNFKGLKDVFQDIGKKQFQFIQENKYFIRGGIAVGSKLEDMGNKNNAFVSNGLARAVYIEANKVDWAIVGTDKNNIEKIRQMFKIDDEEEFFDLKCSYNNKGEEIYFIDFIEEDISYYQLVDSQRESYREVHSIRNKYIWLLRYYHHKYHDSDMHSSLKGVVL
jgi:hypothetical protein